MKPFKRGKTYWVDFVVGGVRHQQSLHTKSRAVAQSWCDAVDTAKRMPTFEEAVEVLKMLFNKPVEGVMQLESAWDNYHRVAKATGKDAIEPSGMTRRHNVLKNFIAWTKENVPTITTVETVNGTVGAKYAEHLADKGLKTKTRRNIIGELSTIWKLLEKASANVRNPWENLSPRDTDGERGKAFTESDEQKVLESAKKIGKDWWAVCTIMRHTGLRYSSVSRLKWSEIQGDVIRHTPPKTKRHNISVTLPIIAPVREALDSLTKRDDYLFPLHAELYGDRGRASREALNFAEVLKDAKVYDRGYTIHSWRHTSATRLADAGVGIETRKLILGHTEDMTAERYDHSEHLSDIRRAMTSASGKKGAEVTPFSQPPPQE